jgi:hypothetical protein
MLPSVFSASAGPRPESARAAPAEKSKAATVAPSVRVSFPDMSSSLNHR